MLVFTCFKTRKVVFMTHFHALQFYSVKSTNLTILLNHLNMDN